MKTENRFFIRKLKCQLLKFKLNIANLDFSYIRDNYFVRMPTYTGIERKAKLLHKFPDPKAIVNGLNIPCTVKIVQGQYSLLMLLLREVLRHCIKIMSF